MIIVFLVIALTVVEAVVALTKAAYPRRKRPGVFMRKMDWQS